MLVLAILVVSVALGAVSIAAALSGLNAASEIDPPPNTILVDPMVTPDVGRDDPGAPSNTDNSDNPDNNDVGRDDPGAPSEDDPEPTPEPEDEPTPTPEVTPEPIEVPTPTPAPLKPLVPPQGEDDENIIEK